MVLKIRLQGWRNIKRIAVKKPIRKIVRTYLYGLCMGTADAVPGVSGGTVALLLGIYERLVSAISSITFSRVCVLLRGCKRENRDEMWKALREMEVVFLISLGAGIVSAVVLIARAVTVISESNPVLLFGVFTGLIAASAFVLYRGLALTTPRQILAGISGFLIAFVLSGGNFSFTTTSHFSTFIVGVIAISAMILPGISGSLFLIIFGKYVYLSSELTAFVTAIFKVPLTGSFQGIIDPGTTVGVFITGGIIGLLTVSRLVHVALARAREVTLTFLVSLIAGSVRAPIVELDTHIKTWTSSTMAIFVGWVTVGMTIVLAIDHASGGLSPE